MIETLAPAKVNLALHVTGQRADGYHLLDSLVVFADIGDRLTFETADWRDLAVTGPFARGVPTGPDNLIWKAVDLIDRDARVSITLEKMLPHGAGLGGGSSDAAATLRALCNLRRRELPSRDAVLALGADVPVCLEAHPARMRGIGELLDEVPPLPPLSAVLVNPGIPVPTGACFAALDSNANPPMDPPRWDDRDSFLRWLRAQRNDLEAPARSIAPGIGAVLERLWRSEGCLLARMSGSGSTCFGLFDPVSAEHAADAIRAEHPDWWVRDTGFVS